jgi:hypothetical protein
MKKTIVEVLLERLRSRIIENNNLRKTAIFPYDLGHSTRLIDIGLIQASADAEPHLRALRL